MPLWDEEMRQVKLRTLGTGALAIVLATGPHPVLSQSADSAVKKTILALYAKADVAARHKDVDGLFAAISPDCTVMLPNHTKLTVAELKPQTKALFTKAIEVTADTKVTKLVVNGTHATAYTDALSVVNMPATASAPAQKLEDHQTGIDSWAKTARGWWVTSTKILTEKTLVNGKPM
jgi:ketosteroid isomerase-like protein